MASWPYINALAKQAEKLQGAPQVAEVEPRSDHNDRDSASVTWIIQLAAGHKKESGQPNSLTLQTATTVHETPTQYQNTPPVIRSE